MSLLTKCTIAFRDSKSQTLPEAPTTRAFSEKVSCSKIISNLAVVTLGKLVEEEHSNGTYLFAICPLLLLSYPSHSGGTDTWGWSRQLAARGWKLFIVVEKQKERRSLVSQATMEPPYRTGTSYFWPSRRVRKVNIYLVKTPCCLCFCYLELYIIQMIIFVSEIFFLTQPFTG